MVTGHAFRRTPRPRAKRLEIGLRSRTGPSSARLVQSRIHPEEERQRADQDDERHHQGFSPPTEQRHLALCRNRRVHPELAGFDLLRRRPPRAHSTVSESGADTPFQVVG